MATREKIQPAARHLGRTVKQPTFRQEEPANLAGQADFAAGNAARTSAHDETGDFGDAVID